MGEPTPDERAVEIVQSWLDDDASLAGDLEMQITEAIHQAEAAAVKRESEQCCKDVCVYCRNDITLTVPVGPNGVWGHEGPPLEMWEPCSAYAIRARDEGER